MKKNKIICLFAILVICMVFITGCGKEKEKSVDFGSLNDFKSTTLDGEHFTPENFKDYDITMINIWTTWCGVCTDEMADLQQVYAELPTNANMIGICEDGNENSELAKKIVTQSGVKFHMLLPDEKLRTSLLDSLSGFPTTVFVDSKGNFVGEAQIGVPQGDSRIDAYKKLLESRLKELKSN